jgi:hypothetical protein
MNRGIPLRDRRHSREEGNVMGRRWGVLLCCLVAGIFSASAVIGAQGPYVSAHLSAVVLGDADNDYSDPDFGAFKS